MSAPKQNSGFQGNQLPFVPVTIATGQQNSGIIATNGMSLVGINLPAAFTGTAITFLVGDSLDATFQPLYNSSGIVSYTVAQGRYVAVNPIDFYGVMFFKIVSGSSETPARNFTIALKGI